MFNDLQPNWIMIQIDFAHMFQMIWNHQPDNIYVYKLYTYINYNIGATYLTGDTPEIQDNNRFGIKPSDFIEALVALALDRGRGFWVTCCKPGQSLGVQVERGAAIYPGWLKNGGDTI